MFEGTRIFGEATCVFGGKRSKLAITLGGKRCRRTHCKHNLVLREATGFAHSAYDTPPKKRLPKKIAAPIAAGEPMIGEIAF